MPQPAGRILWPPHSFDPEIDDARLYRVFRTAHLDSYRRGNRILFDDEGAGLVDLGLAVEMSTIWSRGRVMGCGEWTMSQRAARLPLLAYQAQHLGLFRDQDRRNRERYREISGIDPQLVERTVYSLPRYHALYIRQEGPYACIIGP